MRRTLVAVAAFTLLGASASADVVIRGPFGRQIVVPSPVEVRVGPGVFVGVPSYPGPPVYSPTPAPRTASEPPIVSTPAPLIRPDMDADVLPPPRVLKTGSSAVPPMPTAMPSPAAGGAIAPRDFVKAFKAAPGNYEVTFLHSRTKQPVTVVFALPAGNPEVSFVGHSLLFDYGRHEVEIRFQVGGKVKVTKR